MGRMSPCGVIARVVTAWWEAWSNRDDGMYRPWVRPLRSVQSVRTRRCMASDPPGVFDEVNLVEHLVEGIGGGDRREALRVLGRAAARHVCEDRPRAGVAELHDAVALAVVARRGDDPVPADRDLPVRQPLEH